MSNFCARPVNTLGGNGGSIFQTAFGVFADNMAQRYGAPPGAGAMISNALVPATTTNTLVTTSNQGGTDFLGLALGVLSIPFGFAMQFLLGMGQEVNKKYAQAAGAKSVGLLEGVATGTASLASSAYSKININFYNAKQNKQVFDPPTSDEAKQDIVAHNPSSDWPATGYAGYFYPEEVVHMRSATEGVDVMAPTFREFQAISVTLVRACGPKAVKAYKGAKLIIDTVQGSQSYTIWHIFYYLRNLFRLITYVEGALDASAFWKDEETDDDDDDGYEVTRKKVGGDDDDPVRMPEEEVEDELVKDLEKFLEKLTEFANGVEIWMGMAIDDYFLAHPQDKLCDRVPGVLPLQVSGDDCFHMEEFLNTPVLQYVYNLVNPNGTFEDGAASLGASNLTSSAQRSPTYKYRAKREYNHWPEDKAEKFEEEEGVNDKCEALLTEMLEMRVRELVDEKEGFAFQDSMIQKQIGTILQRSKVEAEKSKVTKKRVGDVRFLTYAEMVCLRSHLQSMPLQGTVYGKAYARINLIIHGYETFKTYAVERGMDSDVEEAKYLKNSTPVLGTKGGRVHGEDWSAESAFFMQAPMHRFHISSSRFSYRENIDSALRLWSSQRPLLRDERQFRFKDFYDAFGYVEALYISDCVMYAMQGTGEGETRWNVRLDDNDHRQLLIMLIMTGTFVEYACNCKRIAILNLRAGPGKVKPDKEMIRGHFWWQVGVVVHEPVITLDMTVLDFTYAMATKSSPPLTGFRNFLNPRNTSWIRLPKGEDLETIELPAVLGTSDEAMKVMRNRIMKLADRGAAPPQPGVFAAVKDAVENFKKRVRDYLDQEVDDDEED